MNKKETLKTKDFMHSKESFFLVENDKFECLQTHPVPDDLASYYNSEDYISHDENPNSILGRTYIYVRSINLKIKYRWTGLSKGDNLLDVGCGVGEFLNYAKKNGVKVDGVELNSKARRIAEERTQQYIYSDIFSLNDKKYDVITLWHVLEHIRDPFSLIKELNTRLNPGGRLIIAVPNYNSWDAKYYKSYWAAYDVPRHLWHFSRGTFEFIKRENEFNSKTEKGMLFDSFYISLISEKYKGHKFPFFGIIVGMISNLKALFTKEFSSIAYIFKK